MAALMSSVIDNVTKVSEYILASRQMGIAILPPDINEGEAAFSVSNKAIRYGLTATKSVGKNIVDEMIKEREKNGLFTSLENFIDRMSGKDLNKRTVENLIKAGAFDSLGGTRKQFIMVYGAMMDKASSQKKKAIDGQLSLFDFVAEEDKAEFEIRLPDVGEYSKETRLAFEKEVIGFYISGHPMEEYEQTWRNHISAMTSDFYWDEEAKEIKLEDGKKVWIGGMITAKSTKITKNNKIMAFLTIEDLVGSVEVIIFPNHYEKIKEMLVIDNKVFIEGRVSISEEEQGKLIGERMVPFDKVYRELWVQFSDIEAYNKKEYKLIEILKTSGGSHKVVIYLAAEKAKKEFSDSYNVTVTRELLEKLYKEFSEKNIKVVEKSIENIAKMN